YLKCHYLAAFTAALLNNQPMGFYRPATIVKDAQRCGLKMFSIDVTKSEWNCTVVGHPPADIRVVDGRSPLVVGQKVVGQKVVGQEEGNALSGIQAASWRENVAHGVGRGTSTEEDKAPQRRKKLLNNFIS